MPARGIVQVAHVNIPLGSRVWSFSRQEMLDMMKALGDYSLDLMTSSGSREWFVWGVVPDHLVQDIQ
jgi:hypothetical protein